MKAAVIYHSTYGSTRQYAEWIATALHLPVYPSGSVNDEILPDLNYLIIGSAVYFGKPLLADWLRTHQEVLSGKKVFIFLVSGTSPSEKDKLEAIVNKHIPKELVRSGAVFFLHGRMVVNNLSWKHRFMLKMGASLEKDPEIKKGMLQDFDDVKIENISTLLKEVMKFEMQNNQATVSA